MWNGVHDEEEKDKDMKIESTVLENRFENLLWTLNNFQLATHSSKICSVVHQVT